MNHDNVALTFGDKTCTHCPYNITRPEDIYLPMADTSSGDDDDDDDNDDRRHLEPSMDSMSILGGTHMILSSNLPVTRSIGFLPQRNNVLFVQFKLQHETAIIIAKIVEMTAFDTYFL